MKYRVLIPTAGLGSRLKGLSKNINKALVSISHKPAISHIIDKFPKDIEFVIPLGYKANTVKDFLTLSYPDRNFIFVEIDKFEGEDSGLGYTILQCEEYLQMPFIFISNDTIVIEEIKAPEHNWMGYAQTDDNTQYRSIKIEKRNVIEICAKGAIGDVKAYIGLAGIYNYKEFWKAMKEGINQGAIEIGESFGLRSLISKEIEALKFTWFDTGNIEALKKTREYFKHTLEANILEKENEAIWFVNNSVIKFSTDKDFIKNRVKRSNSISNFIPNIYKSSENMYAYKKVQGEVFSKKPSVKTFKYFLDWMESFWDKKILKGNENIEFKETCNKFYKEKTYKRVKEYFTTFEQLDSEEIINGEMIPKVFELLDQVDWKYISEGIPVRFHGDLHFENILINHDNKRPFTLLDWRQDFGGILEYGDLYYDLAKLNHGLIVSHELIEKNLFEVNQKLHTVEYDFLRKQSLVQCELYFKKWIESKNYDFNKVQLMTALVYLNIAALHHFPYSKFLFYLGKSMLFNTLKNKE